MTTFGKRLRQCRKDKKLSQQQLAKQLDIDAYYSVISRYERNEITPSIEAAKKLAILLDTSIGYLLGDTEDSELFKDPEMLKRFKAIKDIKTNDRVHILFALDAMIKEVKIKTI